jgi:DNA-binding transcriptional ArsR family regulator
MNAERSRDDVSDRAVDAVAKALADPTRRGLLRLVREGGRSAGELAGAFTRISRPAVSQNLKQLEASGLVSVRVDGNHRMYGIRHEGLASMWEFIEEMWADRLSRLKVAVEHRECEDRGTASAEHSERAES